MVTGLQGLRSNDRCVLTDPAMSSLFPGHYGYTDMGPEGMAQLLLNNTCNSMCNNLPKPIKQDLSACLTQEKLRTSKRAVLNMINSHTTYTWQLTATSRGRLVGKFQEIANR